MFTKMRQYANLDFKELRFFCLKSVYDTAEFSVAKFVPMVHGNSSMKY